MQRRVSTPFVIYALRNILALKHLAEVPTSSYAGHAIRLITYPQNKYSFIVTWINFLKLTYTQK
jgi:hypothetical protein